MLNILDKETFWVQIRYLGGKNFGHWIGDYQMIHLWHMMQVIPNLGLVFDQKRSNDQEILNHISKWEHFWVLDWIKSLKVTRKATH